MFQDQRGRRFRKRRLGVLPWSRGEGGSLPLTPIEKRNDLAKPKKLSDLHDRHLKKPLSRAQGLGALKRFETARRHQKEIKDEQRRLQTRVKALSKKREEALAAEQQALADIVLAFGHVPFEAEGATYDIGYVSTAAGEKFFVSPRRVLK